jgi:hypothetical protein
MGDYPMRSALVVVADMNLIMKKDQSYSFKDYRQK